VLVYRAGVVSLYTHSVVPILSIAGDTLAGVRKLNTSIELVIDRTQALAEDAKRDPVKRWQLDGAAISV
jgi:hypothetical protein